MGSLTAWTIARIRRSRFLPQSSVNRVADADRLDTPLAAQVIVWFPTAPDTLYQLRQWYRALEQLAEVRPVAVICRDSRVSRQIRAESPLDAFSLSSSAQLDAILSQSDVKVALYVNLDPLDFDCLRFPTLLHVYIGHGDSDKQVFASNQVKAFDRYFVAGEAAVERLASELMLYDAPQHAVAIGQPQLDGSAMLHEPTDHHGERSRVVYAPTWEGAHPSMSYSSVISHGEGILTSLIQAGHEVVYRPHPLTGSADAAFAKADRRLRSLVTGAGQTVDTSADLRAAFDGAAVLVTDVSAVVSFWLPSGRPILVTVPTGTDAAAGTLTTRLPRLRADELSDTPRRVSDLITSPPDLTSEISRHLGDLTVGAATATFVAAVEQAIIDRDAAQHSPGHP